MAVAGATRGSYYNPGWQNFSWGGASSIDYAFWWYLILNRQNCGPALYQSKVFYWNNFTGPSWPWGWMHPYNMFTYNLYGDPSLGIGETPWVKSCDSGGTEKNSFEPGEDVYVKGDGLNPDRTYTLWIQNDPVTEGKALATGEDPSGAQETVTTGPANGNQIGAFPPTLIWSIPSDAPVTFHKYDIVVDKRANSGL
ncbi:unnamed protein product, partial [marine sediment metagenome]